MTGFRARGQARVCRTIRSVLQSRRSLLAARGGALNGNVSQGGVKFWKLGFTKIENMRRQASHARTGFHQDKFFRSAELVPHLGKFASQQPPEDGMHVHAGVIIRETL